MVQEIQIKSTWKEMWRLIAVALPRWVIRRMTERSEGKGFAVKAIPFVIMFLSVASIANLSSRAFEHHANFSSHMTGAGIAVLVPIAVIAAMIVEGRWAYAFWVMAIVFAAISGTIQYNIYLLPGGGPMAIAEAVAFGYGVPLSEVMLAIMEARLVIQMERKQADRQMAKEESERQAVAVEQKRLHESEERRRQAEIDAENREFDRQRKQAELDAYRAKLARDAEVEREKALVDLRIKEQKASIKSATQPATSQKMKSESRSTGYDDQMQMLTIYQSEPMLSDEKMAARIGKSKKTIQDLLADLIAKEVVHVEKAGKGKSVTVNGKFEAFRDGTLI